MPEAYDGSVWEDSGAYLMARILAGDDGLAAQQADISSISYVVYDQDDLTVATTTTTSLTVSTVVFDTLQTDARWTVDTTGYNFGWAAPAALFPTGGKVYRTELKFTPASGEAYHLVYKVRARSIARS